MKIEYWCDEKNWHPAANLFPLMPEHELQELATDIKENGLRNPIFARKQKLLDGRNRVLACRIAGITPQIQDVATDTDPIIFVVSQNLQRRHLNTSQRTMIAVEIEKQLAVQAKQRQGARTDLKANLPGSPNGQARDTAAKLMQVSPRQVQDGKKVAKEAPELAEKIRQGAVDPRSGKKLTVHSVKKSLKKPKPRPGLPTKLTNDAAIKWITGALDRINGPATEVRRTLRAMKESFDLGNRLLSDDAVEKDALRDARELFNLLWERMSAVVEKRKNR